MIATVPGATVGLLTTTTKMPSQSFSLPAGRACPSAFYGEHFKVGQPATVDPSTICGSCYAQKGQYTWPVVQHAQESRFMWVLDCQRRGDAGAAEFVSTMVAAIRRSTAHQTGQKYFRVHDSGDLFSVWYADAWRTVAGQLPDVRFWIPTRSWRTKQPAMLAALEQLASQPNVTLRPSALFFNAPAPRIPGFAAGTTASPADLDDDTWTCPAPGQGGKCLDCRVCWDAPEMPVSYHQH